MLTSRSVLRACLVAVTLAAPLAFVAAAHADVACGDQTCPQNYACQSEPAACPNYACAPGDANCVPPDCSGKVDTCEPLPCTADSDCVDGMVCYSETQANCPTTPPCAAGQACPEPADTACTSTTVSGCVPKYLLPCDTDADCGAGFTCEVEQACACSGSTGSGSAGSGTPTPVPPTPASDGGAGNPTPASDPAPMADAGTPMDAGTPDCTCQPTGTKACNLKTIACSADADCPASFTCGDNPSGTCFADANGNSGCTADPAKICLPPWAHLVSSSHFAKDANSTPGSTGGVPTQSDGSAGTTSSTSPIPPTNAAPEGSGTSSSNAPAASEDNGGCSIGRAPRNLGASFGLAALALAGFAAARRRRAR